ncbi:MAG: hypothetical protein ACFCUM_19875 [Bacteroidales bacterium]
MVIPKNRELARLRQPGFLNEKTIDFLNAIFLRRNTHGCELLRLEKIHYVSNNF